MILCSAYVYHILPLAKFVALKLNEVSLPDNLAINHLKVKIQDENSR